MVNRRHRVEPARQASLTIGKEGVCEAEPAWEGPEAIMAGGTGGRLPPAHDHLRDPATQVQLCRPQRAQSVSKVTRASVLVCPEQTILPPAGRPAGDCPLSTISHQRTGSTVAGHAKCHGGQATLSSLLSAC